MFEKIRNFFYTHFIYKQFIPTQDDVESVKSLAERLKGKDDKDTLNNILEWQERNISYWKERGYLLMEYIIFLIVLLVLLIIRLLSAWILDILILVTWVIFGGSLFILIYLFLNYEYFSRDESSIIGKIKKIWKFVNATFKISLTTEEILKYRLAICRDYAKLTAALLLNIYPENKIFFITYSWHVAAGIEINEKLYILDQKLPILELQAWLNRWNKEKAEILKLKRKKDSGKLYMWYFKEIKREIKEKTISYRHLEDVLTKVEKCIKNRDNAIIHVLKNKAIIYDVSDEIIKESLLRFIKNYLQRELVSNFSKIDKINIFQKNNDIIIEIKFKW